MDTESVLSKTDYELYSKLTTASGFNLNERDLNEIFQDLEGVVGNPLPKFNNDLHIEEMSSQDEKPDDDDDDGGDGHFADEDDEENDMEQAHDVERDITPPSNPFRDAVSKYSTPIPSPRSQFVSPKQSLQGSPQQNSIFPPRRRQQQQQQQQPQEQQQQQQQPREGDVNWKQMFADTEFIPEDFSDINIDEENKNPQMRREKQEILFQLLKAYPAESKGQWNMKMPLFELKYELLRREQFKEELDQIAFMKEMMKMILTGVEMLNEKFGPFLQLKGWSKNVTADMSKYDRCMKALYHRYFRKKQMNPVMELLWLIVGSAIMWHIQSKFLGGPPTETQQQKHQEKFFNNLHDIQPPPNDGPKFPFGSSGPGQGGPGINIASLLKLFTK
jgi:hypothetical protein